MAGKKKPKGWVKEPVRHGLASKGLKTVGAGYVSAKVPYTSDQRKEAEHIMYRIRRKHITPEQFMDLTGELQEFYKQFPEGSDERAAIKELAWLFVQLHDDPPRLLREKWGFKPKGGR